MLFIRALFYTRVQATGDQTMPNPTCTEESPGVHVLLVDDNQDFLRAATDLLRRNIDMVVVIAIGGGEQVIVQAQSLRPQVVLVGLDTPNLMSLDTISRLRMRLPEAIIIVLTMLSGDTYRRAVLFAGADEVIAKANLSTELLPAIRRFV